MAFTEIFEQDFDRSRILRSSESATDATRERLLATVSVLALSPGYHAWAHHLMALEAQGEAGIVLQPETLAATEVDGLVCLKRCRNAFNAKHPPCSACGTRQSTRYQAQCDGCGVKFRRKA